jgi:hypothetical protein
VLVSPPSPQTTRPAATAAKSTITAVFPSSSSSVRHRRRRTCHTFTTCQVGVTAPVLAPSLSPDADPT